jgi:ABC-type sugar transport system ATPase subunit
MGQSINIRNPKDALKLGIVMTPESRKDQGLFMLQDIDFNITVTLLDELLHGIRLNKKKSAQIVESYCKSLDVKTPSYQQIIKNLSGGNQQKVILARWLATKPRMLILDEPTRGIDIGTKRDIYELMVKLAIEGISIIFISSELLEVIGTSNRVVVMHEGKMSAVLERKEISEETIIKFAVGGK